MITITVVSSSSQKDRKYRYRTLAGARARARQTVGSNPRRDPDGYAVDRQSGVCLFVSGCKYSDLFDSWSKKGE